MSIDPRYMDWHNWACQTTSLLTALTIAPVPADEKSWQMWALAVLQSPSMEQFHVPDPRYFDSWQSWAFRFNQAVPV